MAVMGVVCAAGLLLLLLPGCSAAEDDGRGDADIRGRIGWGTRADRLDGGFRERSGGRQVSRICGIASPVRTTTGLGCDDDLRERQKENWMDNPYSRNPNNLKSV